MARGTDVGVLGAGAWGTALATVAARNKHRVVLWDIDPVIAESINNTHKHPVAFPNVELSPLIRGTSHIEEIGSCPLILAVVPAQVMRSALSQLAEHLKSTARLTLCAKGIEKNTGQLMTDVAEETIPGARAVILSGPTFAGEVALGLPTAITLAARGSSDAPYVAQILGGTKFRTYISDDPIGAQVAGATKNVLAIACGISAGKSLGQNAIAAIITRGIAEISRLAIALGASEGSMMELAGVGDVVLTCTSSQSRNFSFGRRVGQEQASINELIKSSGTVEGFGTAASIAQLSQKLQIQMPIMQAVAKILHQGANIDDTIANLLTRPSSTI
ncbi:MAG: NAD(P)H-dependent glycerol-3-phosphate dehydrogenase [Pseudomonadota bacterium]|nr:NAD(P)H-dependent glycerol-3-phosphate dehydrogenase [Pseudomonadota bacterium]